MNTWIESSFYVTNVVPFGNVLKVWAQTDRTIVDSVNEYLVPLQSKFNALYGRTLPQNRNINLGAFCCVRFNDYFQRAKILELRTNGTIRVQSLDYGVEKEVGLEDIRWLDGLPECVVFSIPYASHEYVIGNILINQDLWDDRVLIQVSTILVDKVFNGSWTLVNNDRLLRLMYQNRDFGSLLIEKNLAVLTSMQMVLCEMHQKQVYLSGLPQMDHSHQPRVSPGLRPPHNPMNTVPPDNWRVLPPQQQFAQPKPLPQLQHHRPPPEAYVFKYRAAAIGEMMQVQVTHVEDGPQKFAVRPADCNEAFSTLMKEIQRYPVKPLSEPPVLGSVCLGRESSTGVLCRAVVMAIMDTKCKVYYVDFGHNEVLSYANIFQLPPEYVSPKVFCIRFTLSGIKNWHITKEMKEYFRQLTQDKSLTMLVCPQEGPPLLDYGELYDERNRNLKDLLRERFPDAEGKITYDESKRLLKNTRELVTVAFVESCSKFFVQLESDYQALESIMVMISKFAQTESLKKLNKADIGTPCIALYDEDKQWYRGEIIEVKANKIKVLYVDYGNEEFVSLDKLRAIPTDLVKKLPKQAIRCALIGFGSESVNDDITAKFEKLVFEKHLSMTVLNVLPHCLVVELYESKSLTDTSAPGIAETMKSLRKDHVPIKERNQEPFRPDRNERCAVNTRPTSAGQDKTKSKNSRIRNSWRSKEPPKFEKPRFNENDRFSNQYQKPDDRYNSWQSNQFNRDNQRTDRPNQDSRPNDKMNTFRSAGLTASSYDQNDKFSKDGPRNDWGNKFEERNNFNGSGRRNDQGGRFAGNTRNGGEFNDKNRNDWNEGNASEAFSSKKFNDDKSPVQPRQSKTDVYEKMPRAIGRDSQMPKSATSASHSTRESPVLNKISRPNITLGETIKCDLAFHTSPDDFYVNLCSDNVKLYDLMDEIASIYETGGKLLQAHEMKPNMLCIAQYAEDNKWYRAEIQSIKGPDVSVLFIDYGNVEVIGSNSIKQIEPELTKLPIQGVHCNLQCRNKTKWTSAEGNKFMDHVDGKPLEIEFINETNGKYNVLIRVLDSAAGKILVNDLFAGETNHAPKQAQTVNKSQVIPPAKVPISLTDYALHKEQWKQRTTVAGSKDEVMVSWFTAPDNFYVYWLNNDKEFKSMMHEIQDVYRKRPCTPETLQIGSSAMAVFSDDGAVYRAEVTEVNNDQGYVVQYVDFGNCAVVNRQHVFPVEKRFMILPKQAVQCALKNITPLGGSGWNTTNARKISDIFDKDKFECIFHEVSGDKWMVSLSSNGSDVGSTMVSEGLAEYSVATPVANSTKVPEVNTEIKEAPRINISLLDGQILNVKISSTESTEKFYVQFPTATLYEEYVAAYMKTKDPKVMPRLTCHEVCLGAGCLVSTDGSWKRAVVVNCSQTTSFKVRLIDTGAHEDVSLDCMLVLPGELSWMQNQAIECSLRLASPSTELDERFKKLVNKNKNVKIVVNEVDNNRLIVQLYDFLGAKIVLDDSDDEKKICPINPMPILSSTHKVTIPYFIDSRCIYLQKMSNAKIEVSLLDDLHIFYSKNGDIMPVEVDTLCAAFSNIDKNWYRAKVAKKTEIGALVYYIDYGNYEDVPSNSIKVLEPKYFTMDELAIEASLTVTLGCDEYQQLEILRPMLETKEFEATFYNVHKKWVVELVDENGEKISDQLTKLNVVTETKNPETMRDVPPMIVGEKYDVNVTHVDAPDQFWIQRKDEVPIIDDMQDELQSLADKLPNVEGTSEETSICVAAYSGDDLWYRAQILDSFDDIITVRFIDYGNTDIIKNNCNRIKQIPEKWKSLKPYGIKCRLDVIPLDIEWPSEAIERLVDLAPPTEYVEMLVISDKTILRVDLFVKGKSVCDTLVSESLAAKGREIEESNVEMDEPEMDPRSAFVSNVVSVNDFWLQKYIWTSQLEMIANRLLMSDCLPAVEKIEEGMLCVAHYSCDNLWYRAVVLSHNELETTVRYIDYGNTAKATKICSIPDDLREIEPLSMRCCLAKPDGIECWPENINDKFKVMAADGITIFLLDIIEVGEEKSKVKLTLNSNDVAHELIELCEREKPIEHVDPIVEERPVPLGEETLQNVYVTHVVSPSEFWTQLESTDDVLQDITNKLGNADCFPPLTTFEVDSFCVAQFPEDDLWYRSKILSHCEDSGTEVLYVDYGNSAIVRELRAMPDEIATVPLLSTCSALKLPQNLQAWPKEACEQFIDLVNGGVTMFECKVLDREHPVHVSLSLNGENVVDILLRDKSSQNTEEILEKIKDDFSKDSAFQSDHLHSPTDDSAGTHADGSILTDDSVMMVDEIPREIKSMSTVDDSETTANTQIPNVEALREDDTLDECVMELEKFDDALPRIPIKNQQSVSDDADQQLVESPTVDIPLTGLKVTEEPINSTVKTEIVDVPLITEDVDNVNKFDDELNTRLPKTDEELVKSEMLPTSEENEAQNNLDGESHIVFTDVQTEQQIVLQENILETRFNEQELAVDEIAVSATLPTSGESETQDNLNQETGAVLIDNYLPEKQIVEQGDIFETELKNEHELSVDEILLNIKINSIQGTADDSLNQTQTDDSLNRTQIDDSLNRTQIDDSLNRTQIDDSLNRTQIDDSLNRTQIDDSLNRTQTDDSLNRTQTDDESPKPCEEHVDSPMLQKKLENYESEIDKLVSQDEQFDIPVNVRVAADDPIKLENIVEHAAPVVSSSSTKDSEDRCSSGKETENSEDDCMIIENVSSVDFKSTTDIDTSEICNTLAADETNVAEHSA